MTNVELARRAGISAPACLRRMRTLEEGGIITGYRALLDAAALGYPLTAFAMVGLHSQAESDLQAFRERLDEWPMVRVAFMLSGEVDFLLHCVAADLNAFQDFVVHELTAAPNVASVRTALSLGLAKDEAGVPIRDSVEEA